MDNDEIVDMVLHYADGDHRVMRAMGWSTTELHEKLLDLNIEKCNSCGIWTESYILARGGEEDGLCDDCASNGGDDDEV